MNKPLVQVSDKMRTVGVWSGAGLAFAYLTFLSIGSIVLVVALLTAHQFQYAIKTAELDGKPVALWQVIELRENWRVLQERGTGSAKVLEAAQQSLSKREQSLHDAQETFRKAEAESIVLEGKLSSKLVELGIPFARIESAKRLPIVLSGAAYRELSKDNKYPNSQGKIDFEQQLQNFEAAVSAALVADSQVGPLRDQAEDAGNAVKRLQADALDASAGFAGLLKLSDGDNGNKQLLGNFLSQLNALDASWFGLVGSFATMAPDFLTLLLVLAMGTLGGTLHLSRLYIEGSKSSAGYFLYRPFLGAIAALVIFVVARTGVFVVADPGNQNSGAQLSPFFISFVAIVSGLLAEQAIASIQGTGEKWFAGSLKDNTERYAIRVSEETLKQKKDKAQLQKYAEMDDEHLRALFDGSKKVPAHVQKIASVWLRKPVRELFTELPPVAGAK